MSTRQEGSEVRVERVEGAVWVTNAVLAVFSLVLLVYFLLGIDGAARYAVAAVGSGLAGLLCWVNFRRRHILVITPERVGCGFVGGQMFWVDRNRIGSVRVVQSLLLQVRFYDPDGRLFASHVLSHFDAKEIRRAFESAGIPGQQGER